MGFKVILIYFNAIYGILWDFMFFLPETVGSADVPWMIWMIKA